MHAVHECMRTEHEASCIIGQGLLACEAAAGGACSLAVGQTVFKRKGAGGRSGLGPIGVFGGAHGLGPWMWQGSPAALEEYASTRTTWMHSHACMHAAKKFTKASCRVPGTAVGQPSHRKFCVRQNARRPFVRAHRSCVLL